MDLSIGPEYEEFRQEVRDFLETHRDEAPTAGFPATSLLRVEMFPSIREAALSSARWKKPTDSPSVEKKGFRAPSVPGIGVA